MKCRAVLINIIFFICISLNAQNQNFKGFSTEWGSLTRFNKSNTSIKLFPINSFDEYSYFLGIPISEALKGTNGMAIGKAFNRYKLFAVNKDLTEVNTEYIDLSIEGKKTELEFVLKLHDELLLFSSFNNLKLKKTFLFAQTINKQDLKPYGKPQKVVEIDYTDYNRYKKSDFSFTYSNDSSKILFTHNLIDKENLILEAGITVFDWDLNEQWHTKDLAIHNNGYFRIEQYQVCNEGELFVFGKLYEKKRDEEKDYIYAVNYFSENGTKSKLIPIQIADKELLQLGSTLSDNDNQLICAGIYAEEESKKAKGTCCIIVDKTSSNVILRQSTAFLKNGSSENSEIGQSHSIEEKDLKNNMFPKRSIEIVKGNDGGFWLITELYKSRLEISDNKSVLFISKYNKDKQVEWSKKIAKKKSMNLGVHTKSYKAYEHNDKLFLIYVTGLSNSSDMLKSATFYIDQITGDGVISKNTIGTTWDFKVILHPTLGVDFPDGSVCLWGINSLGSKFRFVKLNFED